MLQRQVHTYDDDDVSTCHFSPVLWSHLTLSFFTAVGPMKHRYSHNARVLWHSAKCPVCLEGKEEGKDYSGGDGRRDFAVFFASSSSFVFVSILLFTCPHSIIVYCLFFCSGVVMSFRQGSAGCEFNVRPSIVFGAL
jgi:hypothetical protein